MLAIARQYAKCSKSINPVNPLYSLKVWTLMGHTLWKTLRLRSKYLVKALQLGSNQAKICTWAVWLEGTWS